MEVSKGRGYVYSIQYHVVWCVKHKRDVLTDEISESLRNILHTVAEGSGFHVTGFNCAGDHVRLLLSCKPQNYIPDMIKGMKGVTGRLLLKEFGDELKSKLSGGHVWSPSYFIATSGENTEEQVSTYLQSQK